MSVIVSCCTAHFIVGCLLARIGDVVITARDQDLLYATLTLSEKSRVDAPRPAWLQDRAQGIGVVG